MGSRSLMARAEQQAYFIVTAAAAVRTGVVPVPGGVLVRDTDGKVLGALGISGDTSDNDEAAAIHGVKAAGLTPDARRLAICRLQRLISTDRQRRDGLRGSM